MLGRRGFAAGTLAVVTGMLGLAAPVGAQQASAELLSEANGGGAANGDSSRVVVSSNGRYVAFSSDASNLVSASDTNGVFDAFLYDRQLDVMARVSKSDAGNEGNAESYAEGVANDGTVLFSSAATNLVSGDTNGYWDLFVREPGGNTMRVSVSSSEGQGDGDSYGASISADGDKVAFWTSATNLGGSYGAATIYLRNRTAGTTSSRVALTWDTYREPLHISGNGDYFVFATMEDYTLGDSDSEFDVFLHDIGDDDTTLLSEQPPNTSGGHAWQPSISYSGRYVVFAGTAMSADDTTYTGDLYWLDRDTGTREIVSVSSSEVQSDEWAQWGSVTSDGRYVVFRSEAMNLVPDDDQGYSPDIFLRDRQNGTTARINLAPNGDAANSWSDVPAIPSGGGFVAFESAATNLVSGDTNQKLDVFEVDI